MTGPDDWSSYTASQREFVATKVALLARDTQKVKGETPDRVKRFFDMYCAGVPKEGIAAEGFGAKEQDALEFLAGCSNRPFLHRPNGSNGHDLSPAPRQTGASAEKGIPGPVAPGAMKPATRILPAEPASPEPEYPETLTLPDGRVVPNPAFHDSARSDVAPRSEKPELHTGGPGETVVTEMRAEYTLLDHTETAGKEDEPYTILDHAALPSTGPATSSIPASRSPYADLTEQELMVLKKDKYDRLVSAISAELVARGPVGRVQEGRLPSPRRGLEKSPDTRREEQLTEGAGPPWSEDDGPRDEAPKRRPPEPASRPSLAPIGGGPNPGDISRTRLGLVFGLMLVAGGMMIAGVLEVFHLVATPSSVRRPSRDDSGCADVLSGLSSSGGCGLR